MKILNYLTSMLFLASIVSFNSYSQGYQITDSQSNMYVTDCDSSIHLNVSMETADSSGGETFQIITQGTNPQTSSLSLLVVWGDGSSSTHTGAPTGLGTGIVFTPPVTHTYSTFDNYAILYQVSNPDNNSSIWDSLYYTYANCDSLPNNLYDLCLSGTVYCDQDSNGVFSAGDSPISNALINFTYNGISWTALANQNGQYSTTYMGTGLGFATTAQIDQNWLNQNGYSFLSNPFTTWADTCGNQPTLNLPVNCSTDTISYNCVSIKVFCDANGNHIHEPGETVISNAPVNLWMGNGFTTLYSDSLGMISYCGWFGIDSIMADYTSAIIPNSWLNANGYTYQGGYVSIPLNGATVAFPINCTAPVSCANLYANVTPWIGYYQNYSNTIKISYGNYGPSNPGAYQVSLTFPAGVTPIASSFTNQNYTITGNTMTWNFTGAWAGYSFNDYVNFSVPPGIINGTNHSYTISITPMGSVVECDSSNNSSTLNMIVGQSYDPNDKTVHNQKYIDPMEADVLTYVIRFQNTGTAPAQDVYIIDTISSHLDLNTLEILETSHNLNVVDLGNGVIKFDYPQIWLPDSNANEAASHGYVVYKIKEQENNPIGSSIENTAYIYFDWNPAIITNTTININQTSSLNESQVEFSVYPNPFNDQVSIQGTTQITGYEFMDAAGKVILKHTANSKELMISTAELSSGLYYLNILSEGGSSVQKIVKH